jgi:hypothetical protein
MAALSLSLSLSLSQELIKAELKPGAKMATEDGGGRGGREAGSAGNAGRRGGRGDKAETAGEMPLIRESGNRWRDEANSRW